MVATRAITLPHGVFAEGEVDRVALLRAPTGADEADLLDHRDGRSGPQAVSELLQRCVTRLGGGVPTREAVRGLTVGDREALMLHLRAAAFGERLACVLDCPGCASPMDLPLSVERLLCAPYAEVKERHEALLETDGQRCHVRFRLPTGADHEAVAGEGDLEAGVRLLARRCVEEVSVGGRTVSELPDPALAELAATLARLDPQAEIRLRITCPECGANFTSVFDAGGLLISELAGSLDQLLHEIHAIALHYHWSQDEILALDVRRRRRYLELLVDDEGLA